MAGGFAMLNCQIIWRYILISNYVNVITKSRSFFQYGTVPHYALSYSKLFVWNMTQYDTLLWLDSDTLVAESLTLVFQKADRWAGLEINEPGLSQFIQLTSSTQHTGSSTSLTQ